MVAVPDGDEAEAAGFRHADGGEHAVVGDEVAEGVLAVEKGDGGTEGFEGRCGGWGDEVFFESGGVGDLPWDGL